MQNLQIAPEIRKTKHPRSRNTQSNRSISQQPPAQDRRPRIPSQLPQCQTTTRPFDRRRANHQVPSRALVTLCAPSAQADNQKSGAETCTGPLSRAAAVLRRRKALFRLWHANCPEQIATVSIETSEFCGLQKTQRPKLGCQLFRQLVRGLTLY